MKLTPYAAALRMGKEALKKAMVPVKVRSAQKQAELEMCKLDEQIATIEVAITEQCGSDDLNFARIIEMQDDLALLERRKVQYQVILDQMFPDEVTDPVE